MSSTTATHRPFAVGPGAGALFDVAIASVMFAGSLALLSHGDVDVTGAGSGGHDFHSGSRDLDPLGIVLAVCSAAPLLVWRRFPFGVFVVTATVGVLLAGLGYPLDLLLGPAAALYLLAASRNRQNPWTWRTTAAVVGLMAAFLAVTAVERESAASVGFFPAPAVWAAAWFAGERTRLRREQVADLHDRALRAEREAESERLLAAAEERARIARDLHDSAGHAISVIAVRAGAARLRHHQDPDRSRAALEAIEELARQTVEEIDHIVGGLREGGRPGPGVEAPHGLASLDTLIAHQAAAGLKVTVEVSGTPRALPGPADQGAYRILQEALTNAARHGVGAARIELGFGEEAIELTITNAVRDADSLDDAGPLPDGNPIPANQIRDGGAPRPGGGHGLIGMRERATLLGGGLEVGRANGAFTVRARIPYGGHRR